MKLTSLVLYLLVGIGVAQVVPTPPPVYTPTSGITGQIQTATGGAVTNGTLSFVLSQPAIVSNTAALATQSVSCYTSTNGSVVGVPDPLVLPMTSANLSSGTLPAGNYFVKIYYLSSAGKSLPSPEVQVSLVSQGTLNVNAPILQPGSAVGYAVGIGTTSGGETLQGTVTGWTQYQQSAPLTTGISMPTVNTSSCNIYFSDELIPTGTYYTVNLVNKSGAKIAGYPQTWCTYGGAGGIINVSNGAPTGNCNTNGVFYPTPIFSNTSTNAPQSVNTPLDVTYLNISQSLNLQTPGIFSGVQYNAAVVAIGGYNPATWYQGASWYDSLEEFNNFNSAAAIVGLSSIPSTATGLHQTAGVSGSVITACYSSSGNNCSSVGVYGVARIAPGIYNAAVSGGNFVTTDSGDGTDIESLMTTLELDPNITGSASRFIGLLMNGGGPAAGVPAAPAPGNLTNGNVAAAIYIFTPRSILGSTSYYAWPLIIGATRGSASAIFEQVDGTCITGSCGSALNSFTGYNSSGLPQTVTYGADAFGDFLINLPSGAGFNVNGSGPSTVKYTPGSYSALVAAYPCNSGNQGREGFVQDATTNTWGDNVTTGGGGDAVKVLCDGSNWTVEGK